MINIILCGTPEKMGLLLPCGYNWACGIETWQLYCVVIDLALIVLLVYGAYKLIKLCIKWFFPV